MDRGFLTLIYAVTLYFAALLTLLIPVVFNVDSRAVDRVGVAAIMAAAGGLLFAVNETVLRSRRRK